MHCCWRVGAQDNARRRVHRASISRCSPGAHTLRPWLLLRSQGNDNTPYAPVRLAFAADGASMTASGQMLPLQKSPTATGYVYQASRGAAAGGGSSTLDGQQRTGLACWPGVQACKQGPPEPRMRPPCLPPHPCLQSKYTKSDLVVDDMLTSIYNSEDAAAAKAAAA